MRNALPANSFAEPSARKFPLQKISSGHLVASPENISSAKGYIRYASPSARRRINSAYNASHHGSSRGHASRSFSSPAVSRAVANGNRSLASMMRK
jgi:hypothetical protein